MEAEELIRRFIVLRSAGYLKRHQVVPFADDQTQAEHSYQMLVLLFLLHPNPSAKLVKAILFDESHKIAASGEEREKWNAEYQVQNRSDLPVEDQSWLDALDILESVFWCADELASGKTLFASLQSRYLDLLDDMDVPEEIRDFVSVMGQEEEDEEGS